MFSLGNYKGINALKREVQLVVNLSSERKNFNALKITLYSLLNQSLKPDRIILWLDEDTEDLNTLPYDITQFIKNGLEIEFRKELGKYTDTFYPLKELFSSVNVKASPYIYYPADWLKKLYLSYIAHPDDIHAHRIDENFIISTFGVLYPPNAFTKEALRKDIFLKNAPTSPDVWFSIMAAIHNRRVRIVKNPVKIFLPLKFNKNDERRKEEFNNLMKFYSANVKNKLNTPFK